MEPTASVVGVVDLGIAKKLEKAVVYVHNSCLYLSEKAIFSTTDHDLVRVPSPSPSLDPSDLSNVRLDEATSTSPSLSPFPTVSGTLSSFSVAASEQQAISTHPVAPVSPAPDFSISISPPGAIFYV